MRSALILVAAMLAHPVGVVAQTKGAVVSAKAMEYGHALKQRASPELAAWTEEYVQQHLVDRAFESNDILEAVDESFPGRRPQLRNAVVFLTLYVAIEAERENHESLGRVIKLDDREITRLREEVDRWQRARRPVPGTPQGFATGGGPNATGQADAFREAERLKLRLAQAVTRRNLRAKQQAVARYRSDALLKLLNHSFLYLRDVPPEMITAARPDPRPSN